jgi:hypothetical protein
MREAPPEELEEFARKPCAKNSLQLDSHPALATFLARSGGRSTYGAYQHAGTGVCTVDDRSRASQKIIQPCRKRL